MCTDLWNGTLCVLTGDTECLNVGAFTSGPLGILRPQSKGLIDLYPNYHHTKFLGVECPHDSKIYGFRSAPQNNLWKTCVPPHRISQLVNVNVHKRRHVTPDSEDVSPLVFLIFPTSCHA